MALLGIPAFLLLRSRNWTAFWMAAVIGLAAGLTTWIVFLILFAMSFGVGLRVIGLTIYDTLTGHAIFLLVPSLLGPLVGATFWLIARPDQKRGAQL